MATGAGHDKFSPMLKDQFFRFPGRYGRFEGIILHNGYDLFTQKSAFCVDLLDSKFDGIDITIPHIFKGSGEGFDYAEDDLIIGCER